MESGGPIGGLPARDAARLLRRRSTPAEERLWAALRRDQVGGFHFRRQERIGSFIADFYCNAVKLAVEVDGSIHDTDAQTDHDRDRDAAFAQDGIRTLRVTNDEVFTDLPRVITRILDACTEAKPLRVSGGSTRRRAAAGWPPRPLAP